MNVSCYRSVVDWIVNLRTISHMTPDKSCFHLYHLISRKRVILGDDTVLEDVDIGSIVVDT